MNCKKLELYQTNFKTIVNQALQMHCDKPVTLNLEILLGQAMQPEEMATTVTTFLTELHTLVKDNSD